MHPCRYARPVGHVFILIWGIAALGMGVLFTFRPEIPADVYIAQASHTRFTKRLRERLAPRGRILVWYRIGGVLFMVLGVMMPILVFTGVLSFESS